MRKNTGEPSTTGNKGFWNNTEITALEDAIEKQSDSSKIDWKMIAKSVPGRDGKQCR